MFVKIFSHKTTTACSGMSRSLHIKQYKIIRPIGDGSFAQVFLAQNKGHLYAIKMVSRAILSEYEVLRAFERETRLHMNIPQHPNIVLAKEILSTPSHICFVQEYCPNGDLYVALIYYYSRIRLHMKQICAGILDALLFLKKQ